MLGSDPGLKDRLRRLAARSLHPSLRRKLDASDIVQAGLTAAVSGENSCRGITVEQKKAWLFQVVRNEIAKILRAYGRQKRCVATERCLEDLPESPLSPPALLDEESPSRVSSQNEQAARIVRAIELLPESERAIVKLRHYEDLTLDEIATRLNKTPGSVAGIHYRAIARLHRNIVEEEHGAPAT